MACIKKAMTMLGIPDEDEVSNASLILFEGRRDDPDSAKASAWVIKLLDLRVFIQKRREVLGSGEVANSLRWI